MKRADQNDMLIYCSVRQVLVRLAEVLAGMEKPEAARLFAALEGELAELAAGRPNFPLWYQATAGLDGPRSYGLDRIGLWPRKDGAK